MKVMASVKKICRKCKIVRRKGVVSSVRADRRRIALIGHAVKG